MNERGHVINAVLLAIGVSIILHPIPDRSILVAIPKFGIPIFIGALIPDVDTTFGTHRKTFHNLLTLLVFATFPIIFDNLHYVWIGVLTHYILDLLGNVRGMALFYPWPKFYDIPVGVPVDSKWTDVVTIIVTVVELGITAVLFHIVTLPSCIGFFGKCVTM